MYAVCSAVLVLCTSRVHLAFAGRHCVHCRREGVTDNNLHLCLHLEKAEISGTQEDVVVWRRTALCACRQSCCTLDFSYLYDIGAVCNQACKWPDMYLGNLKSPNVAGLPLQTDVQVSDTWLLRACSYINLTYASLVCHAQYCHILMGVFAVKQTNLQLSLILCCALQTPPEGTDTNIQNSYLVNESITGSGNGSLTGLGQVYTSYPC